MSKAIFKRKPPPFQQSWALGKREQYSSFSLPAVPARTGPQKPNLEVMDTFVRICMLLRQDTEYTEYTEYYASGSTLRTRGHLLIHSSHLRRWVKPPLWSPCFGWGNRGGGRMNTSFPRHAQPVTRRGWEEDADRPAPGPVVLPGRVPAMSDVKMCQRVLRNPRGKRCWIILTHDTRRWKPKRNKTYRRKVWKGERYSFQQRGLCGWPWSHWDSELVDDHSGHTGKTKDCVSAFSYLGCNPTALLEVYVNKDARQT